MKELESAILAELSNSLKQHRPISEAKEDWITNIVQIGHVVALAANEPPPSINSLFELPSKGQKRDYKKGITSLAARNKIREIYRKHKEAIESGEQKPLVTRGKFSEKYTVPPKLSQQWNSELAKIFNAHSRTIKRAHIVMLDRIKEHAKYCSTYRDGGCIKQGGIENKLNISGSDSIPKIDYTNDLKSAIEGMNEIVQKTKKADKLNKSLCGNLIYLQSLLESVMELNKSADKLDSAKLEFWNKALTDEEFDVILNSPMGDEFLRDLGIYVRDPLLAQKTSLEHRMVAFILDLYDEFRKFRAQNNIRSMKGFVDYLQKDFQDREKGEGSYSKESESVRFSDMVLATDDFVYDENPLEVYEDVLDNWDEYFDEYKQHQNEALGFDKETTTRYDPRLVIPTPESKTYFEPMQLSNIPRQETDQRKTVYGHYNAVAMREMKPDFSWIIIYGTEESALGNSDEDECPMCNGHGFISAETLGVKIGTFADSKEYWDNKIEKAEAYPPCAYCDGSGVAKPRYWFLKEDMTPFEQMFRVIWAILVMGGYEPEAYDGFVRNSPSSEQKSKGLPGDLIQYRGEAYEFPVPEPRRPYVAGGYDQEIKNEMHVDGYTTIIKLHNPLGTNETINRNKFINELVPKIQKALEAYKFGSEIEDLSLEGEKAAKKELSIWAWRREPREYLGLGNVFPEKERTYGDRYEGQKEASPSWQFLEDLSKLKVVGQQLEYMGAYSPALKIFYFLGLENRLANIPEAQRYFDLEDYKGLSYQEVLKQAHREVKDEALKSQFAEGELERLMAKAHRFKLEGKGPLSWKRTDLPLEISGYIRVKDSLERLIYSRIFGKPGKDPNLKIYKRNEIYRLIEKIAKKLEQRKIPVGSNPVLYLFLALGYEQKAREYCDMPDELLVKKIEQKKFISDKLLRKLYRRSVLMGVRLFDIIREELVDEGQLSDEDVKILMKLVPDEYGAVDDILDYYDQGHNLVEGIPADPRKAYIDLFKAGIRLLEDMGDEWKSELNVLKPMLIEAEKRLSPRSVKKKINRYNRAMKMYKEHGQIEVSKRVREQKANENWDEAFSQHNAWIKEGGDIDYRIKIETLLARRIIQLMNLAIERRPGFGEFWNPDVKATSFKGMAPTLNTFLFRRGVEAVDFENLVYPLTDTNPDRIKEAFEVFSNVDDKDRLKFYKFLEELELILSGESSFSESKIDFIELIEN